MQFIVISLKTGFFECSEALVGVLRDQHSNSSKVVTLDVCYSSIFAWRLSWMLTVGQLRKYS